jgi:predicted unusual protein kinase regulating ubiquinone biosynthesis (AarF/ABC1/UbiB family)
MGMSKGLLTWDLVGRIVVGSRVGVGNSKAGRVAMARFARDRACEIGPGMIKVAQAVSTREDLVSKEATVVLAELQDSVPAMPPDDVRFMLGDSGFGPELVYDPVPYRSASIAQVHRGEFRGKEVAIKVQRPGIREAIHGDCDALISAMETLGSLGLQVGDVMGMRNLKEALLAETDFSEERSNLELLRSQAPEFVVVPRVSKASTPTVLIMEWLPSQRLDSPRDGKMVLEALSIQMQAGVMHGDMHPGNLGKDSRGRLVLYDCGCVVRMPPRADPLELMTILATGDFPGLVAAMDRQGMTVPGGTDPVRLRQLLSRGVKGMDLSSGPPLMLTPECFSLFRAASLADGTIRTLDPAIDYMAESGVSEGLGWVFVPARVSAMAQDIADLSEDLVKVREQLRTALLALALVLLFYLT